MEVVYYSNRACMFLFFYITITLSCTYLQLFLLFLLFCYFLLFLLLFDNFVLFSRNFLYFLLLFTLILLFQLLFIVVFVVSTVIYYYFSFFNNFYCYLILFHKSISPLCLFVSYASTLSASNTLLKFVKIKQFRIRVRRTFLNCWSHWCKSLLWFVKVLLFQHLLEILGNECKWIIHVQIWITILTCFGGKSLCLSLKSNTLFFLGI